MDGTSHHQRFWPMLRHWLNWREWTIPVLIGLAWQSVIQISFLYSEESNAYVKQKQVDNA